jgi:linearmycin/streptolysin S transport system permease protein
VKALAIAATELRRLVRWRANLFFLFILPMLIILLLGAAFGGASARIGVVGGDSRAGRDLVRTMDAQKNVAVSSYEDAAKLEDAVARGRIDAGILLPADADGALRAGGNVRIRYVGRPDSSATDLRATVEGAVLGQENIVLGAAQLLRARGLGFDRALARAKSSAASVPRVTSSVVKPSGDPYPEQTGQFEEGASTQLFLFIFLTSLNGAVWLVETRRLGIARRMLATPTALGTILAGTLLGRLAIALLQALIIVAGSTLFFGVGWGDPLGAAAVILAFCLVGTGAGMLLGSLASTEQQAGPAAFILGLGLAALGGSMVPLEVFPPVARTIADFTPHAWANEAFSKLQEGDGGIGDVLPQLGVLLLFASVMISLATLRLRRVLTR